MLHPNLSFKVGANLFKVMKDKKVLIHSDIKTNQSVLQKIISFIEVT